MRLAVHSVRSSTHPIGDELRAWDIPTLSSAARGPADPGGRTRVDGSPDLIAAIHALAAPAAAKRFRKQLQEFDIPQTQIEPQFQKRLLAIRRVVLATELTVAFRVRKRVYRPRRTWAVVADEIWLDAAGDVPDLLTRAMADIVFVAPRPRYLSAVLKDALAHHARDFRVDAENAGPQDDTVDEDADTADDVTESAQRHPGGKPDPKRNTPRPSELYSGGETQESKTASQQRKKVVAEDIQRRQLKAEHYAHHCQMALALGSPDALAPAGSYAEYAENRRKIMEAHHPDKTSSSGSRHAGNLLILSRINHERIGARLSRSEITEALRTRWTPHTIKTADGKVWLTGGIAATADRTTGEALPLFFTHGHRDYWLAMAP